MVDVDLTRWPGAFCDDCTTPTSLVVEADAESVIAVLHDDSCPRYAAMPDDRRLQISDRGTVAHFTRSELQDGALEIDGVAWPPPLDTQERTQP